MKLINRIYVIGGDLAGVSTATVLKRSFPWKDIRILKGRTIPRIGITERADKPLVPDCNFTEDADYHVDALKFANWIEQKVFIPMGGRIIRDDIAKVNQNEDGSIKSLSVKTGNEIKADLYIDCKENILGYL